MFLNYLRQRDLQHIRRTPSLQSNEYVSFVEFLEILYKYKRFLKEHCWMGDPQRVTQRWRCKGVEVAEEERLV